MELSGAHCVGYKEPRSKLGVGQLINDGCIFTLTDDLREGELGLFKLNNTKLNHKIQLYETCSQAKSNVIFHKGKSFRLYAKRDISAGEELYLYYGYRYWLSYISIHTNEPFTRLYCIMKTSLIHQKDGYIYVNGASLTPQEFLNGLGISLYGIMMLYLGILMLTPEQKANFLIRLIAD